MSKTKALIGLAVMVGVFAMSVASASAWFEGAKATTGVGTAGVTTFTDENASVKCESATGEWRVRSSSGVSTKLGPDLGILVRESNLGWKNCKATFGIAAEVTECEFELKQPTKGETVVAGAVKKGCTVTVPGDCRIKVPAVTANENLKSTTLVNASPNLRAKVAVTGITSEVEVLGGLGCVGIKNTKNALGGEKGEVLAEGLQEV